MSDKMTPIPFADLMQWILTERQEEGSVFGVESFYRAPENKALSLFSGKLETPFGPAAGPHTQLAQNIAAAYYAGARFFELKTVQTLDGEDLMKYIGKPCIVAYDEAYNCEWSTELTVDEALDEYIKAYFLLKLISREYKLGSPDGFLFNMSVGYDYAGITSEKIDHFIESMKNAGKTAIFQECKAWALQNLQLFEHVNAKYIHSIQPEISNSITLSTLHGCPPHEIERIAQYLITEKNLHTFVKCNPTILGYESVRRILDGMRYDYILFGEHHFNEDLQMKDALPIFRRLLNLARKKGVEFGLKLSNTLPVSVTNKQLPGEEMYMSGRALYPLTMEMASRFTAAFDGRMRISFSGGADAFNIRKIFEAGIWPITLATTILKPGGYARFTQLAAKLSMQEYAPFGGVSVTRTQALSRSAQIDMHHVKQLKPIPSKKIGRKLPLTSCFTAPCKDACPIGQDIPEYIHLVGQGKYQKAMEVIIEKNPLPFITGRICSHRCTDKCMRGYYEDTVRIRNAKLEAARNGFEAVLGNVKTPVMTGAQRVAIVGGGPAGLSAAFFIGRAGMPVTLYEKGPSLGGLVRSVIPLFRVSDHAIDRDILLVEKMGMRTKLETEAPSIAELKAKGYDYVVIAIGASVPRELSLERGRAINVLTFLEKCRRAETEEFQGSICIVGGGNSAMDAARAAKRIKGVKSVSIVYRRTKRFMPAEEEELELAMKDGVQFLELLSPLSLHEGKLICETMQLGDSDGSGRRAPVNTGEQISVNCDVLVSAIGEKADQNYFLKNGIHCTVEGYPETNGETLVTNLPGVYVVGDARGGPATVALAIADAQKAAAHITGHSCTPASIPEEAIPVRKECRQKQGILLEYANASRETERCLNCNVSCEICAQVCPNRANVALSVLGCNMRQILHIDRMCNECGNCAVFCPYADAPYQNKLTLFHAEEDFLNSTNPGFLHLHDHVFRIRLDGETREADLSDVEPGLPTEVEGMLLAVQTRYPYLL